MTSFLNQPHSRRAIIGSLTRAGLATSLGTLVPWREARAGQRHDSHNDLGTLPVGELLDSSDVRLLATRAIAAAMDAGAGYADVRLTRTTTQRFTENLREYSRHRSLAMQGWLSLGDPDAPDAQAVEEREEYGIGIRVLVNGSWGFAASPVWTLDEIPFLAAEGVRQARANAKVTPQKVDLAPAPAVTGHWRPDTVIDPFRVPLEEKIEHLRTLIDYAKNLPVGQYEFREEARMGRYACEFTRQEWALATSEGTFCTQERFASQMGFDAFQNSYGNQGRGSYITFGYKPAEYPELRAYGWELCELNTARRRIEAAFEQFREDELPPLAEKPIDVGRYTVVCGPRVATQLVGQILGPATQLDRAMGYEVNASGSSFLNDPLAMLGTLSLGSPLLNVTGNRKAPTYLATSKWDDEGVEAPEIPLITKGVLTDFQTTRESASWLAPYYAKSNRPARSNGCAASENGLSITTTHPPNIVMHEGPDPVTLEDLIKDVPKGLAILDGYVTLDFQGNTGIFRGPNNGQRTVREIVNGKLGDMVTGAGILFKSSKLWENLIAVGGAGSATTAMVQSIKGQPEQRASYTVSAVPFTIKDTSIVNWTR